MFVYISFHTSPNVYALNTKSMFISSLLLASKPSVNIYTPMRGTRACLIPHIKIRYYFSFNFINQMIFKILYLHFLFTCLLSVCILSFKILSYIPFIFLFIICFKKLYFNSLNTLSYMCRLCFVICCQTFFYVYLLCF